MFNKETLFLLLFARHLGFFLLSPLFSGKSIGKTIRIGLAFGCSLILWPPLITKFSITFEQPFLFSLYALKEIAIGYVIGFVLSLILEAAAFAGQLIGVMMGFSASELLDPLSTSSHPLLARFYSLFIFTLLLVLDLHHPLLKLLYSSFEAMPLQATLFTPKMVFGIIQASNQMFNLALSFAFLPLILLLSLIISLTLLARFFPIFWIGFPLQLIVGLIAIAASLTFFSPLLEHAFFQFHATLKKFIVHY